MLGSLRRAVQREMTRRAWAADMPKACEVCGERGRLERHHVLRRQWVKRHHGAVYDPRNRLAVCPDCHPDGPRSAGKKLTVEHLRDETIAFAVETAGPGPAYNELQRTIVGYDERLAALLVQAS